ncbi:MAG: tetratricopeptide repeat protein [Ferruginibacter sp.]
MKRISILVLVLLTFVSLKSQTIDDAKKHVYYERYETAKNMLLSIAANADASPDTWYWLSEIYLEQNNLDSARAILQGKPEKFLQQNFSLKENPLIFIGWAHVLLDSGMTTEAKKQMEEVLTAGKYKNPVALLAVARANIKSKNGDSLWAVELLEKAIKRDKKNEEIYTALGDAYRRLVDGSNAIISYDKALEINPAYAEAMFKKGRIYKTQNNPEIYVDRFTKALAIDSTYTPALYELYYYYYFRDVVKAERFLKAYIKNADPSPKNAYMLVDLHYVSNKWDLAIKEAKAIINAEGTNAEPRLYKLIAYSDAALGDSTSALKNMNLYFDKQDDSDWVAKDFEMKARLLEKLNPDKLVAVEWYKKAIGKEQDTSEALSSMVSLAEIQKELDNREREAFWRERIYSIKEQPTNLDIYKWGMALYSAKEYMKADSVFSIYENKYPDQVHGYLWRARSNAMLDTTMEMGLAVPHYKKLLGLISADTAKNKPLLTRVYEYLGAYEANTTKDYSAAREYYNKILELEPDHSDARKYTEILNKWIEDGKGKTNLSGNLK